MPGLRPCNQTVEEIYRAESGRVLATLVRLLGDLDAAEEAMQEAFAVALATWPRTGIPDKPRPWLISTARFKAVDGMRRRARFKQSEKDLALYLEAQSASGEEAEIEDDRLRLIFTCCHPALAIEAQVALTLREICGLTTEEIARGFLVSPATLAQRIVRAKALIRDRAIPYRVPAAGELPARLEAVLLVVYLIFTQGYAAAGAGAGLGREAIRLGRLLLELLPEPEVEGLLGLMLLQESRREARTTTQGDLILLEQQDRSRWNREQIEEGAGLTARALRSGRAGAYSLQAAIAAVHARSRSIDGRGPQRGVAARPALLAPLQEPPRPQSGAARDGRGAATDWRQIIKLYDRLLRVQPSPVVELNRAVAVAMGDGLEQGLGLMDELLARAPLRDYHLAHAARADVCRRLGRTAEARASYERALALASDEPERRFLAGRLEELK